MVDVPHTLHVGERQMQAVGKCDGREGVSGTRHPHVQSFAGCIADHAAKLILACRSPPGCTDTGLVANPVAPMCMLDSELVDVHVVR
ncbi:hypothetical protein D3C84_906770 [compost metagenome]